MLGVDLSGSVDRFLIYVRNDKRGKRRRDKGKRSEWPREEFSIDFSHAFEMTEGGGVFDLTWGERSNGQGRK